MAASCRCNAALMDERMPILRLRTACGAGPSTHAFEIGAGTGQATGRLLDLGWTATAIEPDARLSEVLCARCRPKAPGRLGIHTIPFEQADLPETTFEPGIGATSFHVTNPTTNT
jgi:16S rRNA A1518/A1519 N6-dimethyltransferase RsmA/KsgA/DIM1 with predicted DNA glycosylase/AP lyase activity